MVESDLSVRIGRFFFLLKNVNLFGSFKKLSYLCSRKQRKEKGMLSLKELKIEYLERGYNLIKGGGENNYVLIPINKPHSLWGSFDTLESLENYLTTLDKKCVVKREVIIVPIKKEIRFFSLKDEIEHCLKANNIEALVYGAKSGEHHVKILSKSNIDGMIFDSGCHKMVIGICSDMFGNTFYVGSRMKQ